MRAENRRQERENDYLNEPKIKAKFEETPKNYSAKTLIAYVTKKKTQLALVTVSTFLGGANVKTSCRERAKLAKFHYVSFFVQYFLQ